jgi:hypothetical protein
MRWWNLAWNCGYISWHLRRPGEFFWHRWRARNFEWWRIFNRRRAIERWRLKQYSANDRSNRRLVRLSAIGERPRKRAVRMQFPALQLRVPVRMEDVWFLWYHASTL